MELMYRATNAELNSVIGMNVAGYKIARTKRNTGQFLDSDSYAIAEGMNDRGECATWQFHFTSPGILKDFYWGHYLGNVANSDFETRN